MLELKRNSENEEIKIWKVKVATARKRLRDYEFSGQTRLSNPKNDLNTSIAEQKVILFFFDLYLFHIRYLITVTDKKVFFLTIS